MAKQFKLPIVNKNGYYEIRLESIGGLGANLCCKLLGELGAVFLGFDASSFSSYGSEKRGSAVKSYIRWCEPGCELRQSSPIAAPHLLGLFHEALAGKSSVIAGVAAQSTIIVNTSLSPASLRDKLRLCAGTVCCVDAQKISLECKSRVNMIMLGAIVKAAGFIPIEFCEALVKKSIGRRYPAMLEQNLAGVRRGWTDCTSEFFADDGRYPFVPYQEPQDKWGYRNAPKGGANPHIGSTVTNDLSPSREGWIPLLIRDKCIGCGLCDTTCPDMVFQFAPGKYNGAPAYLNVGLDYYHCKGCLRCVNVCPANALVAAREREHPRPAYFMRNQDLLPAQLEYEDTGPNGWITSDSFDTVRHIAEGGAR